MDKIEYKNKAKKLGYSDEYISKSIQIYDEATEKGIKINLGEDLISLPKSN